MRAPEAEFPFGLALAAPAPARAGDATGDLDLLDWPLVAGAAEVLPMGSRTGDSMRLLTFWFKSMLKRRLVLATGAANADAELEGGAK